MVVAYTGKERCDIIYYLSLIANKLNKKILFVDNSMIGDLHKTLTDFDTSEYVSTERHLYLRKYDITQEDAENYDVVFLYNGLYTHTKKYRLVPDHNIICVSANRLEIDTTMVSLNASGLSEVPGILVVADIVSKKTSEATICHIMQQNFKARVSFEADYEIMRRYEFFTWERSASAAKLPPSYREVLEILIGEIFGINEKMLKKLKF